MERSTASIRIDMPIKCLVLAELTLSIQAPACAPILTNFVEQDVVESSMLETNARSPEYSDSLGDLKLTDISISEIFMFKVQSILNKISQLSDDWDGRGARPVYPQTIENVKDIATRQRLWNFSLWQIAPGVNGDIFINYKGKNVSAGIVVNTDVFSYFIENDTSLEGEENLAYNGAQISSLMDQIANG